MTCHNDYDDIQIEDTQEFANYEAECEWRQEREERTNDDDGTGSLWSWSGRGGFAGGYPETRGPDPHPAPAANSLCTAETEFYNMPEGDDSWDSKIPLLSDAQWAHLCDSLGIDPSFSF